MWISCHMCSYKKYIVIFGFLKTMWIWQDWPKSSKCQSWLRNRTILYKFVISNIKNWVKTQHTFLTENAEFIRDVQHIWTFLEFGEIKDKFYWFLISFQKVWCQQTHSVTQFICFQESKNQYFFLIWAHMSQNPYFSTISNMCLMGDIAHIF